LQDIWYFSFTNNRYDLLLRFGCQFNFLGVTPRGRALRYKSSRPKGRCGLSTAIPNAS